MLSGWALTIHIIVGYTKLICKVLFADEINESIAIMCFYFTPCNTYICFTTVHSSVCL